jgi:hypothetical protein
MSPLPWSMTIPAENVNLAKAGAVAIMTSDDLVNLETGLAVRDALGEPCAEVPVVLRFFDRALGRRLEETFKFNHGRPPPSLPPGSSAPSSSTHPAATPASPPATRPSWSAPTRSSSESSAANATAPRPEVSR